MKLKSLSVVSKVCLALTFQYFLDISILFIKVPSLGAINNGKSYGCFSRLLLCKITMRN